MESLTAQFNINLKLFPGHLIGEGESSTFSVVFKVREFRVGIQMGSSNVPSMGHADSAVKRFFFDRLGVDISADITAEETARFCKDFFYYRSILEKYQYALIEAINRIISYFKFGLRNPMLRLWGYEDLLRDGANFFGPRWSSDGKEVPLDLGDFYKLPGVVAIPGGRFLNQYGFGIEKFTPHFYSDFEAFLQTPTKPRLFDQLLSDAQSAVIDGNVRRAVLEFAIGIEVLIMSTFKTINTVVPKTSLKSWSSTAKAAEVLGVLSIASKIAFGESFEQVAPQDFVILKSIFRTRNSIAHEGKCEYAMDDGTIVVVTHADLKVWWTSVLSMAKWLETKSGVAWP
jgi:hypothetical protein